MLGPAVRSLTLTTVAESSIPLGGFFWLLKWSIQIVYQVAIER